MLGNAYFTSWHILYIIVIIPTVFGNGLILYCVWRYRWLRCNMHVLIANLALSDLIVGAVLIPADMLTDYLRWKENKYVCITILAIFVLSMGSSCYNLLIISVERFIAIRYPFRSRTLLSRPRMALMISLGWSVNLLNNSLPYFAFDKFTNASECSNTEAWTKGYQTYLDWILICSLVINFIFYMVVVKIAVQKARLGTHFVRNSYIHVKETKDLQQVITMVFVLGAFVVFWLPYGIMGVIVTFHDTPYFQFVKRCALMPGFFNSAVNWFIYGYRNTEFRKAFKLTLRCRKPNNNNYNNNNNAIAMTGSVQSRNLN